jgi:hypothetical protein
MLAAGGLDIADAFSTDLYTGNGGTQTITNGIDLSGGGGLVWIKVRDTIFSHQLYDSARGLGKDLQSNVTNQEQNAPNGVNAFNSNGFAMGGDASTNASGNPYVSWTFRKAPKFFDVVTYTGNGAAVQTVAHNLDSVPGMIVVKRTDAPAGWQVAHRSIPAGAKLLLDATNAYTDFPTTAYWNNTRPTDTQFYVDGPDSNFNGSGGTYVAYLFAHDTDDDSVVQCGSYTGNGSATGPVITLGWEPQWLLIKRSDSADDWYLYDNQRSPTNPRNGIIRPNSSSAGFSNVTSSNIDFSSTGFQPKTNNAVFNASGGTYVYTAIRKEGA